MKKPLSHEAELHLAHQLYRTKQNLSIRADGTAGQFSTLRACYSDKSLNDLEYGVEGALALQRAAEAEAAAFMDELFDILTDHRRRHEEIATLRRTGIPEPTCEILHRIGIRSLDQLAGYSAADLLNIKGIDRRRLGLINRALRKAGVALADGGDNASSH